MTRTTALEENARRQLARVLCSIQARIPEPGIPYDAHTASLSEVRDCFFENRPAKRVVIILRSGGCEWARAAGGCTMCGFTGAQPREGIGAKDLVEQFAREYFKYDSADHPVLCLYNNGSFLNDHEMPEAARAGIFQLISKSPHIREVVVETRADSVTRDKLEHMREQLPGKRIVVALGLESKSDMVRDLCLHKGMSLAHFEQAAGVIADVLSLRTYVLLKPPFLTEREAVEDAVESIRYAHSLGASIYLEACTVHRHTLMGELEQRGLYRPAWLWSIVEVLRRTAPILVYASGFTYVPMPQRTPENCPRCSDRVAKAVFGEYDRTRNWKALDELSCECKQEWLAEMDRPDDSPLAERILGAVTPIAESLEADARRGCAAEGNA